MADQANMQVDIDSELRRQNLVLERTTEILAAQVATLKGESDWAAIQNAAHALAVQEAECKTDL